MAEPVPTRRVIVAISGASGAVYGARLLQVLQGQSGIETHLVVSDAGWRNLQHELDMDRPAVEALAHRVHDVANVGAAIASGSFQCHAMVVAPCSTSHSLSRKPHEQDRHGQPQFLAVSISTSESPT